MSTKIRIDVVSDVACPWCYVGKKHMEKAISGIDNVEADVVWHPFQLDPSIPLEGADKDEYFSKKFGSIDQFDMISKRVTDAGRNAGINFNFSGMKKVPNTIHLHKLLYVAREEGFADALKAAFLKAYFEDTKDMSDDTVITEIMKGYGWSEEKVKYIISDKSLEEKVRGEIQYFQEMGVNGVPFFIINNKYAFSGAQPVSVFTQAINNVIVELEEGAQCDVDDPNC